MPYALSHLSFDIRCSAVQKSNINISPSLYSCQIPLYGQLKANLPEVNPVQLMNLEDVTMKDEKLLERITLNSKVMTGKPVIRGTRLTVDFVLNLLAHGASESEILNEYKSLTIEDIQACYLFATKSLESTDFMPLLEESA
jgi:uncharacterized protein (DUF433 family)